MTFITCPPAIQEHVHWLSEHVWSCYVFDVRRFRGYAPRNGEGPFDLYIKVASTTKRNPATGKEELLVIYVISFHEDE